MPQNILLVGPMGAGKSSIGRRLAKRINREFIDCDHALEERTGVTITTIFELEGEKGFRERESKILSELCQREDTVIATGGGVILKEENRKVLTENNTVVYLQASVDTQLKRTLHDKNRPLLEIGDRRAKLMSLAKTRNPLYEEVANIIIKTDTQSISNSIKTIIEQLN